MLTLKKKFWIPNKVTKGHNWKDGFLNQLGKDKVLKLIFFRKRSIDVLIRVR
jgi:hypothetical protein